MRLRRGCGCPLIIVLILNIVMVAGAAISLIRGPNMAPVQSTRWGAAFVLVVMIANAAACLILALAALRSQPIGGGTAYSSEEGVDYADDTTPTEPDEDEHKGDD